MAGLGCITLTTATNDFTGAVSLNNSGANNVSVTDANAIVLGASAVGTGTLGVTAGGAITEDGAITQASRGRSGNAQRHRGGFGRPSEHAGEQLQWCVAFGGTVANVRDVGLRNTNAPRPCRRSRRSPTCAT